MDLENNLLKLISCLHNASTSLDSKSCTRLYRNSLSLFEKLPIDVIQHLLLFLDIKSITLLCSVSPKLNNLICENNENSDKIWRNYIYTKYGDIFGEFKEKNVYKNFRKKLGKMDPEVGISIAESANDEGLLNYFQIKLVTSDPKRIKDIENPSEEVQLAAVKERAAAIKYIENPSEEAQLAAVKKYGWVIQFIKNPSEEVQLAAVKKFGKMIRYIENPSEKVQLAVVKQNGNLIEFIKNPSEEAQLAAVKKMDGL